MKYLLLLFIAGLILAGWTININPKFTEIKNPVNEKLIALKLAGAVGLKMFFPVYAYNPKTGTIDFVKSVELPIEVAMTATGSGEVVHEKAPDIKPPAPPEVPNYRTVAGIKKLGAEIWAFFSTWFWDIIKILLFVAFMTEFFARLIAYIPVVGKFISALLLPLPKLIQSIIFGFIACLIYVYILEADWFVAGCLCGLSVILANIGWEYLVNKLGGQIKDKALPAFSAIASKAKSYLPAKK